MKAFRNIAESGARILVPKSKDAMPSVREFASRIGIEVPDSVWEDEYVTSGGNSFRLTPGADMARQIAAGWGDIAICSTELLEESGIRDRLSVSRIGEPICRYSVLALNEVADDWRNFLESSNGRYPTPPRQLPASFPRYLGLIAAARDLPIVPQDVPISGKAEVSMRDNGIGAVADRIDTGNTVRDRGGQEVFKLANIFTEIIMRRQDAAAYQSAA